MGLSCRERFLGNIHILRLCSKFCGADIIAEDYRMSWLTYFVIIATSSFFVCTIYTIYEGVIIRGDWTVILQALCMVGSAVQGLVKLYSVVTNRATMRLLLSTLDNIYLEYEQKRSGYRVYLNKTTALIKQLMILISLIYVFGVTVIVCYPFVHRILYQEKIFVMQFLLPGIDATTELGYALHIASHILCLSFGAFGNFAGDMYIFIFIIHVPLVKDILRCKLEDLNEEIDEPSKDTKNRIREILVNIIQWHQEYTIFQTSFLFFGGTNFYRFNKKMDLSCRQRFLRIIGVLRFFSKLCGADIFAEDYHMSWLSYLVIILTTSFFICTIYTIHEGVFLRNDWTVILQALCMVDSAVQGLCKLFSVIVKQDTMRLLLNTLDNIYLKYEQKRSGYGVYLNKTTALTKKLLMLMSIIYVMTVVIVLSYPLFYRIIYTEKIFVMQFLLPGLDATTEFGYALHFLAHISCLFFGSFGNFAGDMFIFVFIVHVALLKDILHCKLEDFNEAIDELDGKQRRMRVILIDIVEWHQKYTFFSESTQNVFFIVIFVQIFTSASGICCTTFIIFLGVWPAAFAYLIYAFIILYAYCGLGTLVEISNDELTMILYTECLWYKLPIPEQKMIGFMLKKSHKPTALTVGDIMPLSVTTALQLTKAIYSYMMMLLNFVEQ